MIFFNVMASGAFYYIIYITVHSPYLCALDTTLRLLTPENLGNRNIHVFKSCFFWGPYKSALIAAPVTATAAPQ